MSKAIELIITTNTTTPIGSDSKWQGWSVQLRGVTGTVTFLERSPSGIDALVTDDSGVVISITTFPTSINLWVGNGAEILVVTAGLTGQLSALFKPLRSG